MYEFKVPLSSRVIFDDAMDIATINGVKVSGAVLQAITSPTPPGQWFRVVMREDGGVTVHMLYDERLHAEGKP